jgi:hypothetical protein
LGKSDTFSLFLAWNPSAQKSVKRKTGIRFLPFKPFASLFSLSSRLEIKRRKRHSDAHSWQEMEYGGSDRGLSREKALVLRPHR